MAVSPVKAWPRASTPPWRTVIGATTTARARTSAPTRRYETYGPAYRYGWESRQKHQGKTWEQAEPELSRNWNTARGTSSLQWDRAKLATKDAWHRVEEALPGDADKDGR